MFIIFGLLEIMTARGKRVNRLLLLNGWPVLVFFGLAVLASFREMNLQALKLLENHWSLLFVPIIMLSEKNFYGKKRRGAFLSLLFGCLTTLIICNVYLIYRIVQGNVPGHNWLDWAAMKMDFTSVADTHPTYLGLFVVTSILFLIQDKRFPRAPKYILISVLLFGLLQLTSKMALLLFVVLLSYVAVSGIRQHKQQLVMLIFGVFLSTSIFWIFGGDYMQGRMFTVDTVLDEKRIERWKVSYEIFRENPFIGVGYENIDEVRSDKYLNGDYSLAAANDLNAHNQFLEYLSVDGALGGFIYVFSLAFLLLLSVFRRDHLFTFVFFAFIIANLTESMMVRIKGIEYYAIFVSLFLCSKEYEILETSKNDLNMSIE